MTDHARLNGLLDEALCLPPGQLHQWLDCLAERSDPLLPRLRALLERGSRQGQREFLGTLPKIAPAPCADLDRAVCEDAPRIVGPYVLGAEIGSGGMGSVWLAQRSDGIVRRDVALKLPRGMSRDPGLAGRMVREREFLSVLNHPNIARLYDAGVTEDGRPYLALEYVEGMPIDRYCAQANLDLHDRLRLFLQIAGAVAHAHTKLIVHRDLKPANVLVTAEGQVRLLDFGIAKLIEGNQAGNSALTEFSGRVLTVDYASPEQIASEPISTAADIYQLGVMLFELLTGTHPHRVAGASRRELESAILHMEPPKPSERVDAGALRRKLRGDLDTIILHALKKQPEERYATVNAFAEDVKRYLAGRPVCAQPDSAWYRIRKFIGRNRFASTAGGALIFTVSFIAVMAVSIAHSVLVDTRRLDVIKTVFSSIFLEVDPRNPNGLSLPTLERVLIDASRNTAKTVAADDYLRMRLEMRIALVQRRLGKIPESRRRVQLVLDTLARSGDSHSEEYVSAKWLQAAFAMEDGRVAESEAAQAEALRLAATVAGNDRDLAAQARRLLDLAKSSRQRA